MQENTCVSNPLNGLLPWLSNYSQFVLLSETRGGSMARHKGTKKKKKTALSTHILIQHSNRKSMSPSPSH